MSRARNEEYPELISIDSIDEKQCTYLVEQSWIRSRQTRSLGTTIHKRVGWLHFQIYTVPYAWGVAIFIRRSLSLILF
jgi:hypothetical protein